jgi:membrane protein DedA with SNARE-associated domain
LDTGGGLAHRFGMDIPQLIHDYGYAAVAAGAFLEGETVLILAAVSAHLGYLKLPIVMAVAAVCAFFGDNAFFFAGRRYGRRLMTRFPALAAAVPRVDRVIGRWHALAVIVLRFTYGLRIAGPIVLGAGRMKTFTFMWANAVGAIIWALLLGGIGWAFGHAAERVLGHLAKAEYVAIGVVVAIVLLVSGVHLMAKRRLARAEASEVRSEVRIDR